MRDDMRASGKNPIPAKEAILPLSHKLRPPAPTTSSWLLKTAFGPAKKSVALMPRDSHAEKVHDPKIMNVADGS
jgi:hypothetical protein